MVKVTIGKMMVRDERSCHKDLCIWNVKALPIPIKMLHDQ